MPGTVITFYSYKGGVGRSFALANIAVLLARWGNRVLCVDWDLEAPGLHDYFRPMLQADPTSGVADLVEDFVAGECRPAAHITRLAHTDTLDLITAGRPGADYRGWVQSVDWASLYDDGFGEYLEKCREKWTADYDYVLLDSRTGISDIASICSAHLPDRLVVLFTANMQSIRGAVEIAERANAARRGLPFDRPRLTILPVLSRFDTREEYDRSEEWRRICVRETESLFGNWVHHTVSADVMLRHLTLPYVSYWSFGEQLAVQSESSPGADQIGFALETVAAVIAHEFDRTDLLEENRDAYVAAVRETNRSFAYDIRVSTQRSTMDFADELIAELESLGTRVGKSLSGDRSLLGKAEDNAQHLCLIVDGKVSRWQSAEVELFLHRTLGQDRRVIPVLTENTEPNALTGYVGNLRYLRSKGSRGLAGVARDLMDQLNGDIALVDTGDVDLVDLLRQAAHALLRPASWHLVGEIARDLVNAVGAGDSQRAQALGEELAVMTRSRLGENGGRVPVPSGTKEALEWAESVLGARAKGTSGGFTGYLPE
ncbi:tyrosine-protein kinase family protein [Amycolatopsis samaneae]|uniref:Tyrosine-protein kinase family protein n=1 Tax=Amycolatopsis samaneae TaxID=664691 RepID=A0ABW5G9T7_9PSEU